MTGMFKAISEKKSKYTRKKHAEKKDLARNQLTINISRYLIWRYSRLGTEKIRHRWSATKIYLPLENVQTMSTKIIPKEYSMTQNENSSYHHNGDKEQQMFRFDSSTRENLTSCHMGIATNFFQHVLFWNNLQNNAVLNNTCDDVYFPAGDNYIICTGSLLQW